MNRLIKSGLFVFLIFNHHALFPQATDDNRKIVKVLTFNILHGATTKGDYDLDIIADVIKRSDPDLVALQEVDYHTNRSRKYDLTMELAKRCNMVSLFGRAMYYDDGEYGEGILSKTTIIKSRNVPLPHSPGKEPRTALEITTVIPSGDTISFIGTHLDHTRDEFDRISQAHKINEVFADNTHPTILAGDLNATPGSKPISLLEKYWIATYDNENPAPTFPSKDPRVKIDYVMFYPKDRWKIIGTEVIKDEIASDHCAYSVTLVLVNR